MPALEVERLSSGISRGSFDPINQHLAPENKCHLYCVNRNTNTNANTNTPNITNTNTPHPMQAEGTESLNQTQVD